MVVVPPQGGQEVAPVWDPMGSWLTAAEKAFFASPIADILAQNIAIRNFHAMNNY